MGNIITSGSINSAKNSAKLPDFGSKGHNLSQPEVPMVRMVRGADQRVVGDYNTLDVMESENSAVAKLEMWTAKKVGTKLVNTYPNRQWGVQVNMAGQIMIITCPSLSTEKGFHIHMKNKQIDELEKDALRAGGEIMERYGLNTGKDFDPEQVEHLDRDWQDKVISADAESTETL